MRILVVSPHPDDDVIGAGGSLALHARAGHDVTTVHVVGRERAATDVARSDAQLDAEVDAANAVLGLRGRIRLDVASRDFHIDRAMRLAMVTALREVRPEVVYLPHADEVDVEHAGTYELVMDSLWMASSQFFDEAPGAPTDPPSLVLGYEVWTPIRRPAHVQDICETIELKARAMACYESQVEQADWVTAVRGLAAYRGTTNLGRGFAEVFTVESLSASALTGALRLDGERPSS